MKVEGDAISVEGDMFLLICNFVETTELSFLLVVIGSSNSGGDHNCHKDSESFDPGLGTFFS